MFFCSQRSSAIGSIECLPSESLHFFAEKSRQLYGNGRNISIARVGILGTVTGQIYYTA